MTEAALRVTELVPAAGWTAGELAGTLARVAASASSHNSTLQAIADAYAAEPEPALAEAPFSSRRAWSAVQLADATYVLGSPERFSLGALAQVAAARQGEGRRVLALMRGSAALPADGVEGEDPPESEPIGLVVLAERLRPNVQETIAFLLEQGVEVKVLSGDAAETVASIARDVGIPVDGVGLGSAIPEDAAERAEWIARVGVIGRISPEGKRADRPGARRRRTLRGDARRRRQRRARTEGLAPCDRAGKRRADVAQRRRPRARLRRLRDRARRSSPKGAARCAICSG